MIPVLRLDHARAADGTFAPGFLDDLRSALHEAARHHPTLRTAS